MIYSIIEKIYFGDRTYETIKNSKEYKEANDKFFSIYNKLEKTLNNEQKKLFEELYTAQNEIECATALTHYKEGFKIGLLLGAESLT